MLKKLVIGTVVAFSMAVVPAVAASAAPTSGTISIYGPGSEAATSPIVVIGAIGDYGTATTYNAKGKPDGNGTAYVILKLKQGTIRGDLHQEGVASKTFQPTQYQATCSAVGTFTAPVPLISGTGAYKGITGTLSVTLTFAFVAKKTAAGKCSNATGGQFGSLTGSGTIAIP